MAVSGDGETEVMLKRSKSKKKESVRKGGVAPNPFAKATGETENRLPYMCIDCLVLLHASSTEREVDIILPLLRFFYSRKANLFWWVNEQDFLLAPD